MSGIGLGIGLGLCIAQSDDIIVPVEEIPADELAVTPLGDGTLEITAGIDVLDITIANAGAFDGVYQIDPATLETGPVNLVPPQLLGTDPVVAGDTLDVVPGLWIYDPDHGAPDITLAHDGAGVLTGSSYVSAGADGGTSVTVSATAAQPVGSRIAVSSPVTFESPAGFDPATLGTKLVAWWDATDPTAIWQDIAGTVPALEGDPVLRIDDRSGNGAPLVVGGAFGPGNGLRTPSGVDWNGGKFIVAALAGASTGMEIHALIENQDGLPFILANSEADVGRFLGVAESGSTGVPQVGYAGLAYAADGAEITTPTRDDLHGGWGAGARVVSAWNIDWSGSRGEDLIILGYRNSGTFRFFGEARHVVVTAALSTSERTQLTDWLMGMAGQ